MAAEPTADGLRRSEAEARDGVYLAEARWEDADEAGEGAAEEAFTAALTAYREAVAARVRAEERAAAAERETVLRERTEVLEAAARALYIAVATQNRWQIARLVREDIIEPVVEMATAYANLHGLPEPGSADGATAARALGGATEFQR